MPRLKSRRLNPVEKNTYEPYRRNPIKLGEDSLKDEHMKQLRIGDKASILGLSKDELRIDGDLFLDGNLKSHTIKTDNDYLDFVTGSYFRFFQDTTTADNEYLMYFSGGSVLHIAKGDAINWDCAAGEFNFTDNANRSFKIDGANRTLFLYDDDNIADYLSLAVAANGASTIATNDNDGTVVQLT